MGSARGDGLLCGGDGEADSFCFGVTIFAPMCSFVCSFSILSYPTACYPLAYHTSRMPSTFSARSFLCSFWHSVAVSDRLFFSCIISA